MKQLLMKIAIIIGLVMALIVIAVTVYTIADVTAQNIPPSTKSVSFDRQQGATAQCRDNEYSYATSHAGTCSGHGGVKIWF